ncbi:hypothetical protein LPB90_06380 [Chryseobacterium sp. LC2016-29]|uniref:hypothetical protein n=1 Tax=Chryseobacterium sp. LC2016-29 TaxID=2897331 RepID=UPI001E3A3E0C|nr:hypothetical protein [Chryseobacterium sp. LC2016-29]MCD0478075.1 hypothetical protein [Chryseobacterium sp. LC2016-29]
MEEIKEFVINFTKQEAETIYLRRQPDLENYNKALQVMDDYSDESLHDTFGMIKLIQLYDQEYYEKWGGEKYPNTRHIYKISHYKDDKYGDVYLVYLSTGNPRDGIFTYGACLFLAKVDNRLKFIRKYIFGDEMLVKDKFEGGQGLEDISFNTLKKPINIERYLEPADDEDGMEHYLKDI